MNIPADIYIKQFIVGSMGNFCYFLGDIQTKEVAVVDPGFDAPSILALAKQENLKIVSILLTHSHYDHVGAVDGLVEELDLPIYISINERGFIRPKNVKLTKNHEIIKIGQVDVECIFTPGHTSGGQCFKAKNILITGDTVFVGGCGRCDLPTGDARQMYKSLYEIILKMPDDTIIFPGHSYGPADFDTIENQRVTNPYLTCASEDEFLAERMGL